MEMRRGNFDSVFGGTKTGEAPRDLMDAVRMTQTFRDVVSDSGTATGMSLQGLLPGDRCRRLSRRRSWAVGASCICVVAGCRAASSRRLPMPGLVRRVGWVVWCVV